MTTAARQVGFPTALALVVGGMIGSGVFTLPSSLSPYGVGTVVQRIDSGSLHCSTMRGTSAGW